MVLLANRSYMSQVLSRPQMSNVVEQGLHLSWSFLPGSDSTPLQTSMP